MTYLPYGCLALALQGSGIKAPNHFAELGTDVGMFTLGHNGL